MHGLSASFLDLSNEIICEILAYCDPQDIAHSSQVCKRLYDVAAVRSVWAPQIRKLKGDCTPSMPPWRRLQSLDNDKIRNIVADATHFRNIWLNPERLQIVKTDEFKLSTESVPLIRKIKIVPGGQYALLIIDGLVELWSLERQCRIWAAPSPEDYRYATFVDLEVIERGKAYMLAARYGPDALFNGENHIKSVVRLFRFDCVDMEGEVISDWRFPSNCLYDLSVHGDYFHALFLDSNPRVVVNWKVGKGTFVEIVDEGGAIDTLVKNSTLYGNHLIATVNCNQPYVFAISLPGLQDTWTHGNDASAWSRYTFNSREGLCLELPVPEAPPLPEGRISEPVSRIWCLSSHILAKGWMSLDSETSHGDGEMFLVSYTTCNNDTAPATRLLMTHRMRLSLPLDSENTIRITLEDAKSALTSTIPWDISERFYNSGQFISLANKNLSFFSMLSDEPQPVKSIDREGLLPNTPGWPTMMVVDPWSGVILCSSKNLISLYRIS